MKLYSGGFARFFLGDWQGFELDSDAEGENLADDEEATPDEVRRYFETFRNQLAITLSEESPAALTWSEALDGLYEVVTVSEREFGALLIIASRVSIADKRMNPISLQKEWHMDPAVVAIQDAEEGYLPVHHLVKADTWLPVDFVTIIETEVPERDLIIGSLPQLVAALEPMDRILNTPNETTRKLSAQLVADARAAHVALTRLATWAADMGMPILIEP